MGAAPRPTPLGLNRERPSHRESVHSLAARVATENALSASSWNLNFDVRPRTGSIYGGNDCIRVALDARPTRRGKHDDGELSGLEILLILQVCVGSHQDYESIFLSRVQQFTILKPRPAVLVCRYDLMLGKQPSQRYGSTLVEEDAHSDRS